MILMTDRRTEQCHKPITQKLVDSAFVSVDFAEPNSKNRFSRVCMFSGPIRSAIAGDTARSQNSTVTCLRSPSKALLRGQNLLGKVFGRVGEWFSCLLCGEGSSRF